MRKEHHIAKNYHFMDKEPRTSVEWMEVMQHHGVKTRLLDWSESMIHPVIFSLECFFDNKNCIDSLPTIDTRLKRDIRIVWYSSITGWPGTWM